VNRPVIVALGVSHRDVDLAILWLRWVTFLGTIENNDQNTLLIVFTRRAREKIAALADTIRGTLYGEFKTALRECPDEMEDGYPKSASHLLLRTLEMAERTFPGHAVLWCEADTVPTRPSWFREIFAEYQTCGKPFMGVRVGDKPSHMSGIAVYAADWRMLAPSFTTVLDAPDNFAIWPNGRGQAWDIWTRAEVVPQMAETKTIHHVWKHRDVRRTRLSDIPAEACLFHQDKTGALIREIAAEKYPGFMANLNTERRFYKMIGHKSRLKAKGISIAFSWERHHQHTWQSAVCSIEVSEEEAQSLALMAGKFGISEITEDEFVALTGKRIATLKDRRTGSRPAAAGPVSHPNVFVMLGRYGDICNILPLLKAEADAGRRPTLVVAQEFASILDGVSYVDRIVWEGAYDALPEALRWLRASKGIHAPVIAQYHRHPTDKARLTDSFQKECWRLAGRLDQFDARGPLVFDLYKRKEAQSNGKRPIVLVAMKSVSSPFAAGEQVIKAILPVCAPISDILLLDAVKVEKVYELLDVFDSAALLVTVDTMHLHLARASRVPVVAIINEGWRGSVPPENTFASFRYSQAAAYPSIVAKAVQECLSARDVTVTSVGEKIAGKTAAMDAALEKHMHENPQAVVFRAGGISAPNIFHVVDVFGSSPRHIEARATWMHAYAGGVLPVHVSGYPRDAKTELGDPRALPFLKDLLKAALDQTTQGNDIIVWTNSDIGFFDGAAEAIRAHLDGKPVGATSMRRTESNGERHMGRDLFAFKAGWLMDHWDELPDYVIGAPAFDLGLVAMIRKYEGEDLPATTKKNMLLDFPPADMPSGFALHQSHASEWDVNNVDSVPSVRHNKRLFHEWAKKYAPEIKFSKGGNLL
jgi:hypothetical protein